MQPRVLILGVGNPLRGDDGIGPAVIARLRQTELAGVTLMEVQQLQTELLELFHDFTQVVIADAAVDGPLFRFFPVTEETGSTSVSSHHTSPVMLRQLYRQLYGRDLSLWICSVQAESFDLGAGLSAGAQEGVRQAVSQLTGWLQAGCPASL